LLTLLIKVIEKTRMGIEQTKYSKKAEEYETSNARTTNLKLTKKEINLIKKSWQRYSDKSEIGMDLMLK
jgi:hypothetical protein